MGENLNKHLSKADNGQHVCLYKGMMEIRIINKYSPTFATLTTKLTIFF